MASPEHSRNTAGAVAWRCNTQTNPQSARQLHFWMCSGGTIKFVSVVTHDDFLIVD